MTRETRLLNGGSAILPVTWRRAQSLDRNDRVECAVYRDALTIWRGEPYDGSWPLVIRANGSVYLPKELRDELGWASYQHVDVEWDEDDDTLVLRKAASAEGVA